jgi:hypothetical protein
VVVVISEARAPQPNVIYLNFAVTCNFANCLHLEEDIQADMNLEQTVKKFAHFIPFVNIE